MNRVNCANDVIAHRCYQVNRVNHGNDVITHRCAHVRFSLRFTTCNDRSFFVSVFINIFLDPIRSYSSEVSLLKASFKVTPFYQATLTPLDQPEVNILDIYAQRYLAYL